MEFLKRVKEKRTTTSNLDEFRYSEGDGNSRTGVNVLEEAIEQSAIFQDLSDDDDNSSTSKSFKPNPPKTILKPADSRKKETNDNFDNTRIGLMKALTTRMEEKHKSNRLKFFESIMPQVDEMTDDCFLDFQLEILNSLKRFRQHLNTNRVNYNWDMTSSSRSSMSSHPTTPSPASTHQPIQSQYQYPSENSCYTYL